jgi:hypothetical protein
LVWGFGRALQTLVEGFAQSVIREVLGGGRHELYSGTLTRDCAQRFQADLLNKLERGQLAIFKDTNDSENREKTNESVTCKL